MPKNSCGYRENSTSTQYKYIYERTHGDQEMIMQALNIDERAVTNCTMQVNLMAQQFADIHLQDLIKLVFSWSVLLEQWI
jgi:hypothetical protein